LTYVDWVCNWRTGRKSVSVVAFLAAAVGSVIRVDAYRVLGARVPDAARLQADAIDAALGERAVPVACATHFDAVLLYGIALRPSGAVRASSDVSLRRLVAYRSVRVNDAVFGVLARAADGARVQTLLVYASQLTWALFVR
jgi:hypothetical protein